jgi:holin-like protein
MACLSGGELISELLHIPIPGNVIGMIILFVLLLTGIVKLEDVDRAAGSLIGSLSLFFVPVGVGIMMYFDLLSEYALAIFAATVLSTMLVLAVTGGVTQGIIRIGGRRGEKND